MLVSLRCLIIATIPSSKNENPHVAFSKRYPTVDLRGKRLCSLHVMNWCDLPSDDLIVEEVLHRQEHEFIIDSDWGPVIQIRKKNTLYIAVPLISHLETSSKVGLFMVPTAACITTLETIAELYSILKKLQKDKKLVLKDECSVFDVISVYVSTTIPLGSVGDDLSPGQFLRKFNYVGNPCSPSTVNLRQVEYLYGETNCGNVSYPSIWGCLEADADTPTPVNGKIKILGQVQDLSIVVGKIIEDQELPDGHQFVVKYTDGISINLASYSLPAPPSPPLKGSFKAYMPKTTSGIADLRCSLTLNLNPLESEKKKCFCELSVKFNFGTGRSVANHTLVPTIGVVHITVVRGVKTLLWKIPKNRRITDASITGKCTFIAAKESDENDDYSAPFLTGSNCFADVLINAVGYKSSSGVTLSSATVSEGTITIQPPVLKSTGLRIWNGKAIEPACARLL